MNIRFTSRATQNLLDIADYLTPRNPQAARRVRTAILESLQHLVLFPRAGRRQSVAGVRKLVVRRYPNLIYYVVYDPNDEIVIVSIMHPAREREFPDD